MGKVTVKHFLNKKVKGFNSNEAKPTNYFALYVRMIANRKSTEFKSRAHLFEPSVRIHHVYYESLGLNINDQMYLSYIPDKSRAYIEQDDPKLMTEEMQHNELVSILDNERVAWQNVYKYMSERSKENFTLKDVQNVKDEIFTVYDEIFNERAVNRFKKIFLRNSKFASFSKIISPEANIVNIYDAIEIVSSSNSEFQEYYNNNCSALKNLIDIKYSYFLKYSLIGIPLIIWISEGKFEDFKTHILSITNLAKNDVHDMISFLHEVEEVAIDKVENSIPEKMLENMC